ncbi:hypothetical protein DBR27_02605 [Flavobacterium sp. HMWF030]|nr:hypothetical protein DBR27_02605 [Flavobacterium sp. HMWF030]
MNKYLKYLLSLILVFAMIANDGVLGSQSKSADYYQSSFVITKRESDFKAFRLYKYNRFAYRIKTIFSIVLNYLNDEDVYSFQINIVFKFRKVLYQKINSFINQSVFLNEIIISNNFKTGLYRA